MREERPSLRRAVAALQHREYRLFYIALVVAGIGAQIQATANIWQIYELTHSPLHLGLTGLARGVPVIILSLMGGIIADRVDRRRFIMLTQAAVGAVSLVLAALTVSGNIEVWHIYAATVVGAALSALGNPARAAMIPNLVPRQHLLNALALQSTVWQTANIVGPSIAGLLIAAVGLPVTYLANGSAHLVSLLMLGLMHVGRVTAPARVSPLKSLTEGLTFVRRNSIILALLGTDTCATFFGSYRALLPFFATAVGVGASGLGLMFAAPGVGALLGSTLIMSLGDLRYKGLVTVTAILGYCLALVLLAVSPWFILSLVAVGLLGLLDSLQATPRNAVIQSVTPDEVRGRVSSFQSMLTNGVPSLGQTWSGVLAAALGPPAALIVGASACAGLVVTIAARRPDLRARELGSEAPSETPSETPRTVTGAPGRTTPGESASQAV